jgi:hypothetical protein
MSTTDSWQCDDPVDCGYGVYSIDIWSGKIHVATVGMSPMAECQANARLVAAAPDLLEVAHLVMLAPLQHGIDLPDELLRIARAAIHKATGRE